MASLNDIGRAIGNGVAQIGNYTAQAASRANGVSFAAQAAQGAFNQASADTANAFNLSSMANQYAYNSASAADANAFTESMWNKAAAYNTEMFERQMEFNSEQARINRDFQKEMDSTKYQRAIKDMKAAGLNPILAVTSGIGASGAGGSSASVSAPQMGSASGAMASGSALSGAQASEGNFTCQMEYMSGILGLISAAMSGFSSAFGSLGSLGDLGEGLGQSLASALTDKNNFSKTGGGIVGAFERITNPKNKHSSSKGYEHGGGGYSRN